MCCGREDNCNACGACARGLNSRKKTGVESQILKLKLERQEIDGAFDVERIFLQERKRSGVL